MEKLLQKMQKIGNGNIIMILLVISALVISGLYSTFSLYTFSEGVSIVDGVKTLRFILGNDTEDYSVMVAPLSSKSVAITISNKDELKLKYGIYYYSDDDLKDVEIGYRHSTEYLPNGVIEASRDYIVTIQIENNSDDVKDIKFGLVYGLENGGDFELEEGRHFLDKKINFPLNEVPRGSYVEYAGNNGCVEEQCKGVNANKTSDDVDGYCGDDKTNFYHDGWRVAYTRHGSAYIISAGALECISRDDTKGIDELAKSLNDGALKYCNLDYAYNGVCDKNNSWAMNKQDFYYIVHNKIDNGSCIEKARDKSCGYNNSVTDIGSYYWVSNIIGDQMVYYNPLEFYYITNPKNVSKGLRPVIRLASSVVVVDGDGTIDNPYKLKNTVVATYEYKVVYNGNGATSGDVEDSTFITNNEYQLNKNKFKLDYHFNLDDIAVFDDSYCDDNGCHESSIVKEQNRKAKFLGWSLNMDDKEAMYLDEQKVTNLSVSSEDVVVNLYAIWDIGINILPDIQKRDGYEVMGWYTEKDGGEKVGNPGDRYTGEKINLYARWEKKNS